MLRAFASILLAAATTPPLRVEITSLKTRLSVFEPVKLTVRATATLPVVVPAISNPGGSPAMETWIDYGAGFVEYRDVDDTAGVEGGVGGERSLAAGDHFVKAVVLVQGRIGEQLAVPFSSAGRYPLRVVFRARPERDGAVGAALGESNAITFEVVAPDAEGQAVVQAVRSQPWILRGGVDNPGYDSLVTQFPTSPYLHWGKRAITLEKGARIGNGRYPDTDDVFDEGAQGGSLARMLFRQLATDLQGGDPWGQFDEERLALAAENFERGGAYDRALPVWREIAERFPGSEAAEQARSRIDTTQPSLQVAASPASLWPPNHKLVPITVAVQVSDDTDASPSVRLVSITCDDGCDPALDVAGAVYGTDDREFDLRSERKGTNAAGRTYTITYSAEDAAGNKATAETKVTVAHDQGKKG